MDIFYVTGLNWKSVFHNIMRLIVQFWLLPAFLHCFGLPAWRRYQDKKVLVVTSMLETGGLKAPAVTVIVNRNDTQMGWKSELKNTHFFVESYCKDYMVKGQTIIDCIEEQTYDQSEILKSVSQGGGIFSKPLKASWTEDFTHNYPGRQYTLQIPGILRIGRYQFNDLIRISFEPDLVYSLFVHDPKYFYISRNPETAPPSVHKIVVPDRLPYYYRLGLTEVEHLNLPNNPCNEDPDYNFNACVKERFSQKAGCRTKWDHFQLKHLPLCSKMSQFR